MEQLEEELAAVRASVDAKDNNIRQAIGQHNSMLTEQINDMRRSLGEDLVPSQKELRAWSHDVCSAIYLIALGQTQMLQVLILYFVIDTCSLMECPKIVTGLRKLIVESVPPHFKNPMRIVICNQVYQELYNHKQKSYQLPESKFKEKGQRAKQVLEELSSFGFGVWASDDDLIVYASPQEVLGLEKLNLKEADNYIFGECSADQRDIWSEIYD